MTAVCPVCSRPQDQGLMCEFCTSTLTTDLRGNAAVMGVAELVDNLHVAQAKQDRLTEPNGGARKGDTKHERLPLNLGAMEAVRELEFYLGSWARDLTADKWRPRGRMRAVRIDGSAPGPFCPTCRHGSCAARREYQFAPDRYIAAQAADVLLDRITNIRRHGAVSELVDEIGKAIDTARAAIDQPPFSRFPVGPCPEDDCDRTVFALCPAEGNPRPALMACYQRVKDENRPDLGAGFVHAWNSSQFYRVGGRIRRKMEARQERGAA